MAPNGHFFGQIPQPMQRLSEMKAILESGVTSMQSFPVRTTGHDFLHSWRHFYFSQYILCFACRAQSTHLGFALHIANGPN